MKESVKDQVNTLKNKSKVNIDLAIAKILNKYDRNWFLDQSRVEPELMSDIDHTIYVNLYEARERLFDIEVLLANN